MNSSQKLARSVNFKFAHICYFEQLDVVFCMLYLIVPLFTSSIPYFQVRDVRLIMDRNSRRSKGVGYALSYSIIYSSCACTIVVLGYQLSRIMFNCILKWTSNAIMMRDDGNTLHSCLINSCCVLKVDDIIPVSFLVLLPIFFLCISDMHAVRISFVCC